MSRLVARQSSTTTREQATSATPQQIKPAKTNHGSSHQPQSPRQRCYKHTPPTIHLPSKSAHVPASSYTNSSQRKEAEAAARSLRHAQARLERYRQIIIGHAATESNLTQPLLDDARTAISRFKRILHPGSRAREVYESAKRDFDETTRLLAIDIEREIVRSVEMLRLG